MMPVVPPSTGEAELVRQAQRGDPPAIRALIERHAPRLFVMALSLLAGNETDAEDVVQETLLGALRGLPGFRHRSSIKTWLYGILFRQAARHRRRRDRVEARLEDTAPAGHEDSAGRDVRLDVQAAIQNLSRAHREVIVLRELAGLSYQEISQVLSVKMGTVESRLARARRELRERLTGYGAGDRPGTTNGELPGEPHHGRL